MTAERFARRTAVLALASLAACASVPEDAGFPDAASLVRERAGHEIHWRHGAAPEEAADAIEARVSELLAGELDVEDAVEIALLENRHLQSLYEDLRIA